jgi:hypothetical protein
VGTGGRSLYAIAAVAPHSEFRQNTAIGIIRFELEESGYRWRFIPTSGAPLDEGSAACH